MTTVKVLSNNTKIFLTIALFLHIRIIISTIRITEIKININESKKQIINSNINWYDLVNRNGFTINRRVIKIIKFIIQRLRKDTNTKRQQPRKAKKEITLLRNLLMAFRRYFMKFTISVCIELVYH